MMKSYDILELDIDKEYTINVLPLKDLVFFPHMVVPLIVGRPQSIEAVERAMEENRLLFLVSQKNPDLDEIKARNLHRFGVMARILQIVRLPNNLLKVLVEGLIRGSVRQYRTQRHVLRATIHIPYVNLEPSDKLEALRRELVSLFKTYIRLNEDLPEELLFSVNQLEDLERVTDFI
ncbi:MAG: endopeptidase La, partial [Calditrichaeota bacterium]